LIDALDMKFRQMKVRRDTNCPVCGDRPTIRAPIDYEQFCGVNSVNASQSPWDIEASELKRRMDTGDSFLLLDVREPHEYEICNLDGKLIPLGELEDRHVEIDRDQTIVVHCKLGMRSARAVKLLRDLGFNHVENLKGGINGWSRTIDPNVPMY
jgi:sulfur-carrier protein adenylyltransferase/sulfurtransferase